MHACIHNERFAKCILSVIIFAKNLINITTQDNVFKYKKCKFLPRIVIKGVYRYI